VLPLEVVEAGEWGPGAHRALADAGRASERRSDGPSDCLCSCTPRIAGCAGLPPHCVAAAPASGLTVTRRRQRGRCLSKGRALTGPRAPVGVSVTSDASLRVGGAAIVGNVRVLGGGTSVSCFAPAAGHHGHVLVWIPITRNVVLGRWIVFRLAVLCTLVAVPGYCAALPVLYGHLPIRCELVPAHFALPCRGSGV